MLPDIRTTIPGPCSLRLAQRLGQVESQNVTYLSENFPVFWGRAQGTNVWDVDGNRFLDLTSAFAVSGLGHTAPAVVEALVDQSRKLMHGMGDVHPTELKVQLCERLSEITFARWGNGNGKTILTNSGFEAVEAALKTAFIHTRRRGVLAFHGAYHGLGYGALDVCGLPFFQNPFREQLGKFTFLARYPRESETWDAAEVETLLREESIGCVLVEPIQGRGGDVVPPLHFLPELRRLCDQYGSLLIFDEIYTGFNRTGELFASDLFQTVPDLICLGKGLASGFPISACVGKALVMDSWPRSEGEALHTSTFLGNPIGCRMALASIEEHLKPKTREQVRHANALLRNSMSRWFTRAQEIRGSGLMLGVQLERGLAPCTVVESLRAGILVLAGGPNGDTLSLAPPFSINEDEIDFFCRTVAEIWENIPVCLEQSER